jgi:hypothetical protein
MDESPYPIVLRAWGGNRSRAAWGSTALVFLSSFLLIAFDLMSDADCYGCEGGVVLGGLGILSGLGLVWRTIRRGAAGLELRIERHGFVLEGDRVPWDAVMTITWKSGPTDRSESDFIEIRVRETETYRPPRDRVIFVRHGLYEIKANLLIDLLEAAALPRRIRVLAVEPPTPAR